MTGRLFTARSVALGGGSVVVQMTGGPEEAARHEIEIPRIRDGLRVVPDRGAENAGLAVVEVCPDIDPVVSPILDGDAAVGLLCFYMDRLLSVREDMGRGEDMDVVVVLFPDRGPIAQAFVMGSSLSV